MTNNNMTTTFFTNTKLNTFLETLEVDMIKKQIQYIREMSLILNREKKKEIKAQRQKLLLWNKKFFPHVYQEIEQ